MTSPCFSPRGIGHPMARRSSRRSSPRITICKVTRKEFLTTAAAGTLALRAIHSAAPKPPHIVFVLTDDQGYGDLACHGNPYIKTPHIDRLHGESVRFTDFHASPTCSPTRASLMTGRHEFKSGVTHTILERERLSLKATT